MNSVGKRSHLQKLTYELRLEQEELAELRE